MSNLGFLWGSMGVLMGLEEGSWFLVGSLGSSTVLGNL